MTIMVRSMQADKALIIAENVLSGNSHKVVVVGTYGANTRT